MVQCKYFFNIVPAEPGKCGSYNIITFCSLVIMKIFLVGESLLYMNWDNTLPILVVFSAELLMGMHHNNLLTVSNTKFK